MPAFRATCRRRIIQLNRFGKWLVSRDHLKVNPLATIEIPRREKRLPEVLPWSVAEQVVAGEPDVRNRAILAVLVYTGLRRGEAVGLRWAGVDLDSKHLWRNAVVLHVGHKDVLPRWRRERAKQKLWGLVARTRDR